MEWHIGMMSGVRLAAITAPTSATVSTSPLAICPVRMRSSVAICMRSTPLAMATRWVLDFSETSTMRARPASEKWVSLSIY